MISALRPMQTRAPLAPVKFGHTPTAANNTIDPKNPALIDIRAALSAGQIQVGEEYPMEGLKQEGVELKVNSTTEVVFIVPVGPSQFNPNPSTESIKVDLNTGVILNRSRSLTDEAAKQLLETALEYAE